MGRLVNVRHSAHSTSAEADTTPPVLIAGGGKARWVNGAELVLTFERAPGVAEHLDETSVPGTGEFYVFKTRRRPSPMSL